MTPLLQADGLTLTINGRTLCQGLDLRLEAGQCWGLLGVNGAGKSTLLHALAGLRTPQGGHLTLDGRPLAQLKRREAAQRIGLLPQDSEDPFPATVLETALIGRHPHLGPWRGEGTEDYRRARAALHTVGLEGVAGRMVQGLSGGERRRLAFATLLTQDPALFLLDEPTNHLDLHHQHILLGHLKGLTEAAGKCVLMALHDPNLAARYCTHVLMLFGEGAWQGGPAASLLGAEALARLYGHPIVEVETPGGRAYLPG